MSEELHHEPRMSDSLAPVACLGEGFDEVLAAG